MDPLDIWTNEELLRFFRSKRTEMSCFHPPYTFLNQLRDDNIIPEEQYKKVINIKSKSKREMGMYELLDWLETERPQNIKLFWSCVFKDHLLQRYPTLRLFRNSLIYDGIQPNAGSLEFNNQSVKVEEPGVEVVETKVEKDNKRQSPEEEDEVVVVEPEIKVEKDNKRQPPEEEEEEEVVVVEPEIKVEKDNKRQPPEEEEEVVVVEPEVVVVEPEMKVEKDNKRQPPEEEEEVVVVEPEVVVVEPEIKVEKDNKRKAPEEEEVEVEPEVQVVETKVEVVETKVEVVETEVEVETKVEVVETKLEVEKDNKRQAPEDAEVDMEVEKDNKREAPEEGEETGSKKKQKIMGRSIVYELPGSSSSSTQAQMREDLKPTYDCTLQPEKKENKPQLYRPDSSSELDISMLTKYKTQLPVTCREFSITLYRDKLTLEPEVKKKTEEVEEAEVEVELETEEDQMYGDGNRPKRSSIYDKTKTVNRNFPVMCANLKGTRSSVREPAEEEVEKEEEEPQKDIWNLPKYKTHLPVTCGTLKGMLNRDKMALGEPCILVNGEWVTPPVFMKLVGRGFWKWYVFCQDTRLCQLIKEGHLICPGYQRRKAVHSRQVKAITHWNTLDSSVTETEVEEEKEEEEEEEVEEYEDILLKSISLRIAAEEDSSDDAVHMQSSQ